METPVSIYGLIDPDCGLIRYIGKSIRPKERLGNHMNEVSNCHRSHWLQSLKARGLKPQLVILEWIPSGSSWQDVERRWIAHGKAQGWPLTNNTSGGDGVCGLPAETRAKMAATWRGRKHKPESLAKLKAARANRGFTEETRDKYSATFKGREITWKDKLKEAVRKLTDDQIALIRRRLDGGERVVDLANEFGVHRTTMSKIKAGAYYDFKQKTVNYKKLRRYDAVPIVEAP